MKLIHATLLKLGAAILVLLTIWATFFYFKIIDEVNDETDDSLENYSKIIIKQALSDHSFIRRHDDVMTKYYIIPIDKELARNYTESYLDSTVFIESELEYEPVRVLKTPFMLPDGSHYELTVMTSTLEKDDMLEAIFHSIIILYAILLICILSISTLIFKKSLKPLYILLDWLNHFTLGKTNAPLVNNTLIKEFTALNESVCSMTRRSEELYKQQKQFIENAAHELQTPLAICLNKLELLSEQVGQNEQELNQIAEIYDTVQRTIRLNKSLLLLSRIENRQFPDGKEINVNHLTKHISDDLKAIFEEKEITLRIENRSTVLQFMNESLAATLITNLLKNAFVHTPPQGEIQVIISGRTIDISNSTFPGDIALDEKKIFERFYRQSAKNHGSTGLGLSIVRSITNLYSMSLKYYFDGRHHFQVSFDPKK